MPTQRTYTPADGYERIEIRNDHLCLEYIPQLGGKIAGISDVHTGRQWLWRHPRMPYAVVPHTANYVTSADTGGWDECFPTVGTCAYPADPWQGVFLADHGELWCQAPATSVSENADTTTIHTLWRGINLPYTFERTLTIGEAATITCDYRVTNDADAPLHWIWCAHPLLAIEPGMAVETPAGTTFFRLAADGALVSEPATALQPTPTQTLDLGHLPDPAVAYGIKLYSDHLPRGYARLQASDGAFSFSWQTSEVPQLAIWFNAGAWAADGGSPYYNMGIEPAIGVYDPLADAYTKTDTAATLAPGASRAWQLTVTLDQTRKGA